MTQTTTHILAAGANQPAGVWLEPVKDVINFLFLPEISLPFFFLPMFVLMIVLYRWWTKPVIASILGLLFVVALFGGMLIDDNYHTILAKPDNAPIPLMLLGTALCLWVAFRQAAINDQNLEQGKPLNAEGKDDKTLVWPDLVYTELICILLASAVLIFWAILLPAPLEAPANPEGPPNPSKAPWYFLGLQELLVYFDPWKAGVLLPGLIVVGLIAIPYIDINPKGNGYYTFKQRPFAITMFLFGFIVLWMVLIVFGTFLRGPNWNFFGPFEPWNAHIPVPLTNINLSDYVWDYMLQTRKPDNPIIREWAGLLFCGVWFLVIPVILTRTVMHRLYLQMGMSRYVVLMVLLTVMAIVPLKMVLRWLFVLKYFVSMPEYNLNL